MDISALDEAKQIVYYMLIFVLAILAIVKVLIWNWSKLKSFKLCVILFLKGNLSFIEVCDFGVEIAVWCKVKMLTEIGKVLVVILSLWNSWSRHLVHDLRRKCNIEFSSISKNTLSIAFASQLLNDLLANTQAQSCAFLIDFLVFPQFGIVLEQFPLLVFWYAHSVVFYN